MTGRAVPGGDAAAERQDEEVLYAVRKYNGDELRVTISEYQGRPTVQIRDWFIVDGRMRPSRKGTSIPVRELGAVARALDTARERIEQAAAGPEATP